ncbi:Lys-63-specific deubiquitinase BRCC36 [Rhynchospora pubera]|uniref:Lys-63-specific deubiquitinase BRCC36 n=1 Tax=Rhynchospora pubera TaxID=906938 RepID=A0AAV8DQF0_9POAL|nr:Lys-63-specific deubiquitinase BRCC36 [Rhynchospora pubera]KAJ4780454.1 Lys-63-specific deubiquitinase BRCC36 [Rhynchospora pubera]
MSLTMVKMTEEVWLTCVAHSLSTESEEIVGLLLGDIQKSRGGDVVAMIWGALPQMRCDRRKDRVETNPELLSAAAEYADIMSKTIGKTTRVIGWYHSHPHITVLPSHVDVRTQATYQLLDQGFIGLIFSCFNEDPQKVGRIQVIAFQSLDRMQQLQLQEQQEQQREAAMAIVVPSSSSSSSSAMRSVDNMIIESAVQDSADSSQPAEPSKAAAGSGSGYSTMEFYMHSGNPINTKANPLLLQNNDATDLIPIGEMSDGDMSASMQEALHRSTLEVSGAEYARKEVPFQVLPTSYLLNLESPLASFGKLQHVLYDEERSAYKQALQHSLRDGKMHPLTYVHHSSTYHASLCKLMETCLSPAIAVLQDRLKQNEIRMEMLKGEAETLEAEAKTRGIDATKAESPRRSPRHPQGSPKATYSRRKPS